MQRGKSLAGDRVVPGSSRVDSRGGHLDNSRFSCWVQYVLLDYGFLFSSALAHVGGIIVGLIALRRVGMDRTAWLYAFAWALFMQMAARLLTTPELNVNISHNIQPGWERYFTSYWKFWIVLNLATAFVLWTLGRILSSLWPEPTRTRAEIQTA